MVFSSMTTITIHRATEADMNEILSIITDYNEAVDVLVRDNEQQIKSYLQKDSGIWLAFDKKSAIGCVILRPLPRQENACEVKRLYVRESYRGKGIADALMNALESYALEYGYQFVYLDSKDDLKAAIRFYERRCYAACARYNDNPQATLFMRQSLTTSPQSIDRQ
jgi:N-acetylglutamate synthase-like GNAT family acetyltransferase